MRKFFLAIAGLMVATTAFAQYNSTAGLPNDAEQWNHAWRGIQVVADLPDQVKFEMPAVKFEIAMSDLAPSSVYWLEIAVYNKTDRPIVVTDPSVGGGLSAEGFQVYVHPVEIGVGGGGYVKYQIVTPSLAQYNTAMQFLFDNPDGGWYTYQNGKLTMDTALVATGKFN